MNSHGNGPIIGGRIGSYPIAHNFLIDRTNQVTATNVRLLQVKASTTNPVAIRIRNVVQVAETTTGASSLSVGSASGGTQYLNAVDLKATAGTNQVPTNNVIVLEADGDVWAAVARADANGGGGRSYLTIEMWDMQRNTTPVSTAE